MEINILVSTSFVVSYCGYFRLDNGIQMNSTEQKIRDAFEKEYGTPNDVMCEVTYWDQFDHFKAGYLALLNELEPSYLVRNNDMLYRLPEGVTKP